MELGKRLMAMEISVMVEVDGRTSGDAFGNALQVARAAASGIRLDDAVLDVRLVGITTATERDQAARRFDVGHGFPLD